MARVFPIEEWAPNQLSQSPNHHDQTSWHDSFETSEEPVSRSNLKSSQRSLPSRGESDLAAGLQHLSLDDNREQSREHGKKEGGIRGLLRRASVSIKSKRQRRHSHAVESRPSTASAPWLHRLREAASFSRHSKMVHPDFDYEEDDVGACDDLTSPIPGYGDAPPIIPHGSGGAAARATAAAQNEFYERHRHLLSAEDQWGDRESGIGIAMTTEPASRQETTISRIDFISLLPVELAIQILAHLDHRTLYNTALVSQSWARVSRSQHVWREAFLREKSKTYATSAPVKPGSGLGLPPIRPDSDWNHLYRMRQQLEHNWREGKADAVYLNGHLDSIYCVQFDE